MSSLTLKSMISTENQKQELKGRYTSKLNINDMMGQVKTLKGKQTLSGIVKNQSLDLTTQILRFSKTNSLRIAPKTITVDRTLKGRYASKLNMNNKMGQVKTLKGL